MSPRSEEFLATARDRLAAARAALEGEFAAAAVSSAYYAMLYAARAALSEEDRSAKTHRGVWSLFGETFVASGRFDAELAGAARRAQRLREAGDYDAAPASLADAGHVVDDATRFLDAVASLVA